ncbi:MAG: aminotransferase class I/II-fold pyridoxal phosphate-dependent enzyme [Gammaproteobacteria bacterium]|nr:aminotransferase class I/II-fold pyridoxal phosphate-dependent enzyme [Gammaproteobacteria bacterium]MYF61294.1 aminotransferase class I/II-fold pyridoxal phosphate-dependent enzyme [Gammaproteobacteria bacterium]MYI23307.1 aminotransferase class I/II-fold pyridoxal phosphate-dependent enzyme [Gammaproteobacteria bacterium]
MQSRNSVTRRRFMGGAAAALGYAGLRPTGLLGWDSRPRPLTLTPQEYDYDSFAKLSSNENPYGPSERMMEAMNGAWKYANRYGYPDGDIQQKIAEHHGVESENILLGAGSGETLRVVAHTYLGHKKKVIGVRPTYLSVFGVATGIDADAIMLPLLDDYSQDIPAMIDATKKNYRDVGLFYLCNPNNPTGMAVPADDVRRVLDEIPEDIPVLIDEAYHHFVEDPAYETAVPYVNEGRKVIVARTFSKIYGMAGLRLGYGIAPPDMISDMRTYTTGSVNALVRWGGVAALEDLENERFVRETTLRLRKQTTEELQAMGYEVLPSETNFFMVNTGRPAAEVRAAFRERGVLVGRDFPPMLDYLRVSVGTEEEMARFMTAWKEIMPPRTATTTTSG